MRSIIVVDQPRLWSRRIPEIDVMGARQYLSDRSISEERHLRVFNLCRSYRYQSLGYYVSLLAMARGHVPLPSITTVQDMRSASLARIISEDLSGLIQRQLRRLRTDRFTLSIYFGRNVAKAYDELSARIFRLFQAPLIRARFRREDDEWRLDGIRPIPLSEIPAGHEEFITEAAREFFERDRLPAQRRNRFRYDLAILFNENEATAPSDMGAIKKLTAAARRRDVRTEIITKEDYIRLAEFDALFIRETTQVHQHTYRFARRATAEGLVVIDDPESIIKCTNKVYLAELMDRYRIPTPATRIVSRDNREDIVQSTTFPTIVKQPDSSFSQGVFKVESTEELQVLVDRLLEDSEMLILQEFVPTEFDWRVGVLDRQVLFACKYHMVKAHWQIARSQATKTMYGDVEAVALEAVPKPVLATALRAANMIGDGLYGVDIKQLRKRVVVMEINDNPNIESGCEDTILGNALYDRIITYFVDRIDRKRTARGALT